MKTITLLAACCMTLLATIPASAQNNGESDRTGCCKLQEQCSPSASCPNLEMSGIVKAIEYYIDGGRKGDSQIARKGFAENATMSWMADETEIAKSHARDLLKTLPCRGLRTEN